jgi:hypothetical protein
VFLVVSILLTVLLLMEAGEVVTLPPRPSAVLPYLLYFSLFAVIAATLLEVMALVSAGAL